MGFEYLGVQIIVQEDVVDWIYGMNSSSAFSISFSKSGGGVVCVDNKCVNFIKSQRSMEVFLDYSV